MSITASLPGISKPTPKILRSIFNAILYLSGLWAIVSYAFAFLPVDVTNNINKIIVLSLPVLRFTITFFHYDYDINNTPPTQDEQK